MYLYIYQLLFLNEGGRSILDARKATVPIKIGLNFVVVYMILILWKLVLLYLCDFGSSGLRRTMKQHPNGFLLTLL